MGEGEDEDERRGGGEGATAIIESMTHWYTCHHRERWIGCFVLLALPCLAFASRFLTIRACERMGLCGQG